MPRRTRDRAACKRLALFCCLALPVHASSAAEPSCAEAQFLQENVVAMEKMMAAMDARPTGNVDRDFVAMMVPHHQGAIDMARLVLRYGEDERIRRLAQEIIVTQQQEIIAMRLAMGADASEVPAGVSQAHPHGARGATGLGSTHGQDTRGSSAGHSEACP